MARTRNLAQLIESIRWQADQERAELRHTDAAISREINLSTQRYREFLTDNGHPYYLKSHSGKLPVGASLDPETGTRFAWGTIDIEGLDPGVARIYGLDVTVESRVFELDVIEFGQRNHRDIFWPFGSGESVPREFFIKDETQVCIVPPADRGYPFTLWYLPVQRDLANKSDLFSPGVVGGEQWVVWDVVHKLAVRDHLSPLATTAWREREAVRRDIEAKAAKRHRVGPVKRVDTRGRTRAKARYARAPWRR